MDRVSIGTGRFVRHLLALGFIGTAYGGVRTTGSDFKAWARSSQVYLNTAPGGANVTDAVLDFPVLIRLADTNFAFAEARAMGQDIRFSKPDGTPLPHQIERWDAAAKRAEVWVRMDTVKGNASDRALLMYWGNPAATDISNGEAVFTASAGFAGAWHLGGTGPRANSVAGGGAADPREYAGDESRIGVIGYCDSLDGNAPEEYLSLPAGFSDFDMGFTYSVWAYPASTAESSMLLQLGSGAPMDNIMLLRLGTSSDLAFKIWNGVDSSRKIVAKGALVLDEWQHFDVTVAGGKATRIYRNGILVAADTLTRPISRANRTVNEIGWGTGWVTSPFRGKLDEPRLHRSALGPGWVRLAYENQRPGQTLVSFKPASPGCQARFQAPRDTTVAEGASISLTGLADCASSFEWTPVSGPTPHLLDPVSRVLFIPVPRVSQDTEIVYRFSAGFGDSVASALVRIAIKETIPDPVFTLPVSTPWDGKDSLVLRPAITNLAELRIATDQGLHWVWSLLSDSSRVDTSWQADGLMLKAVAAAGNFQVQLCLDNGGSASCRSTAIEMLPTSGIRRRLPGAPESPTLRARLPIYDARGRRLKRPGGRDFRRPEPPKN